MRNSYQIESPYVAIITTSSSCGVNRQLVNLLNRGPNSEPLIWTVQSPRSNWTSQGLAITWSCWKLEISLTRSSDLETAAVTSSWSVSSSKNQVVKSFADFAEEVPLPSGTASRASNNLVTRPKALYFFDVILIYFESNGHFNDHLMINICN